MWDEHHASLLLTGHVMQKVILTCDRLSSMVISHPKTTENNLTYCWWKKSCTGGNGKYPIIYRVWDIPGGAGFLSSTVSGADSAKNGTPQLMFNVHHPAGVNRSKLFGMLPFWEHKKKRKKTLKCKLLHALSLSPSIFVTISWLYMIYLHTSLRIVHLYPLFTGASFAPPPTGICFEHLHGAPKSVSEALQKAWMLQTAGKRKYDKLVKGQGRVYP